MLTASGLFASSCAMREPSSRSRPFWSTRATEKVASPPVSGGADRVTVSVPRPVASTPPTGPSSTVRVVPSGATAVSRPANCSAT